MPIVIGTFGTNLLTASGGCPGSGSGRTPVPFRIRCPKCETAYNIADEKKGKSIRCSKCQEVFRAEPPDADDDETAVQPASKATASKKPASNSGAAASKPRRSVDEDDDETPSTKKSARRARDEDDDDAERPAKKKSGAGRYLIGCGALALVLLVGCSGAAIYGFYWLKNKAGELADQGQAHLKKVADDLKKNQDLAKNQDKRIEQPSGKDMSKGGSKDRPPTKDGPAKKVPPKLPPGPITWSTYNAGQPANFVIQFPGKPFENSINSKPGEVSGEASVHFTDGTRYVVSWKDWGKVYPDKTPQQLLDLVVMQQSGRHAMLRLPIIVPAGQSCLEFKAQKDSSDQPRNRAERAFAVNGWVYEIYIDSPADVKPPANAVTHFLTAFRYTGPTVTGGPKSPSNPPKTPSDPPPAGGRLAKLTFAEPMGWGGRYLAGTDEWIFTRPISSAGRTVSNTIRVKASNDAKTLEEFKVKIGSPGFPGPKTYRYTVTTSDPLPDGFVIHYRYERKSPTKSKLPATGIGIVVVRNVGSVRLVFIAAGISSETIRDEAITAIRSARLGS